MMNQTTRLTCPAPLAQYPRIVMGHGSGGAMMKELIDGLFVPAFEMEGVLGDGAVLDAVGPGERLVFSTDSFVVAPPFFPGGDIGSLAVYGTVNDVAMMGARPLFLSTGFILEEGLEMDLLIRIVASMARAARAVGVRVVTGDTKVVEKGHGDGVYINTTGVGLMRGNSTPSPDRLRTGDVLIINGTLGDHGAAVMSLRNGLGLETDIVSDARPLHGLVDLIGTVCDDIHVLRDLTRGGLAAALNELCISGGVGMEIFESAVPVRPQVASLCEILGFDPFQVANEGKFVAAVPRECGQVVLEALQSHPFGCDSAIIGEVTEDHPGVVVGQTSIGGRRVIDLPAGALLPRIC